MILRHCLVRLPIGLSLVVTLLVPLGAQAQTKAPTPAKPAKAATPAIPSATAAAKPASPTCAAPGQLPPSHLHGLWQLSIWPMDADPAKAKPTSTGAVMFYQHPEYADSVRGRLMRSQGDDSVAAVTVGDLLGGIFKMDESPDGVRLVGTWEGAVSGDGCGNEITGSRLPIEGEEEPPQSFQFALKKIPR